MTAHPSSARRGFTLLEMAVVLAALGLVLLLLSAILVGALKTHQLTAGVSRRLVVQGVLADQFRADVAGAEAAPESLGPQKAGPACLILRLPDGKHVVYRWREGRLERSEAPDSPKSYRPVPVGDDRALVEFGRAQDGRLLSLRLVETGKASVKGRRVVEVSAALGGDLR